MATNILFLVLAACLSILYFTSPSVKKSTRSLIDAFIEAIDRLGGGGPATPMHPSSAGDDALLRSSKRAARAAHR